MMGSARGWTRTGAVLVSLLPPEWRELARHTRALKGLRKDKSAETLLRVLLLHLGCGHSLRETVVRARKAKLAQLSDVALLKRLRKSRGWLHALCVELFREQGVWGPGDGGFEVRAFDATTVKEPGRTGALWRIHYSVRLPSLTCDFFKLTASDGEGAGESFAQFPIRAGDHVVADRGYSTACGIGHVAASGGHVLVRVNTGSLRLRTCTGERFDWLAELGSLTRTGAVQSWPTVAVGDGVTVPGRVCAARKSTEAIRIAQDKLRKEAPQRQAGSTAHLGVRALRHRVHHLPRTDLRGFAGASVVSHPWQVELVFKRFKSLAQLGHLPKHDDESAKAWLYGKLLVALLVEKLIHHAVAVSPWGYDLDTTSTAQRMA